MNCLIVPAPSSLMSHMHTYTHVHVCMLSQTYTWKSRLWEKTCYLFAFLSLWFVLLTRWSIENVSYSYFWSLKNSRSKYSHCQVKSCFLVHRGSFPSRGQEQGQVFCLCLIYKDIIPFMSTQTPRSHVFPRTSVLNTVQLWMKILLVWIHLKSHISNQTTVKLFRHIRKGMTHLHILKTRTLCPLNIKI